MGKKATIGIMVTLLLVSIVTLTFGIQLDDSTSPVSAVLYEGTLDTWYSFYENDTWHTYSAAKTVESNWDITIQGSKAIFFMEFVELNIEEEKPGTYDNFRVVMIGSAEATLDGYNITGLSYWWKNEEFRDPTETVITISETNLPAQFSMEIPGWLITGSLFP